VDGAAESTSPRRKKENPTVAPSKKSSVTKKGDVSHGRVIEKQLQRKQKCPGEGDRLDNCWWEGESIRGPETMRVDGIEKSKWAEE